MEKMNAEIPVEIREVVASTNRQIVSFRQEESDYPDRNFQTINIAKDATTLQLGIVQFVDGSRPWDVVQVVFKNCVYQDAPRPAMLKIVEHILLGNVVSQKTAFRKKSQWIVKDETGSVIGVPAEIWDE